MPINDEVGLRVSRKLKNKIKHAATMKDMSMVAYLDKIVPEIEVVEVMNKE